jgi:hypothetical protein
MMAGVYLSIEQAQHFDQRPFRSMLIRGWVAYLPGRGFRLRKAGRRGMNFTILASNEESHHALGAARRAAAYGLAPARRKGAAA